jgi:class 3 adenylate cyclase
MLCSDTGDLRIRVGLHSGTITAGVLKGANARFQLFGDTMNMADRMEHNSLPNCIMCSETTANLVQQAGKEHWIRPREDKVLVKGKGEVQTYWLVQKLADQSIGSIEFSNRDEHELVISEDPGKAYDSQLGNTKLVFDLSTLD